MREPQSYSTMTRATAFLLLACAARVAPCQVDNTLTIDLPGGVPLELVRIPAGGFQMGSNDDASWSACHPCEQPVHAVNINYDFFMGKYEVTQAQWEAVMGTNPSFFMDQPNHPVETVSWDNCQEFITTLNAYVAQTQQWPPILRLPSEAEWEYACRAGKQTRFSFGDAACGPDECNTCELGNYAWWCGNSERLTHEVGQLTPNFWGLYDMHGNVWEWCADNWHESYADGSRPGDGSPWLSSTPPRPLRVLRGGGWVAAARNCRSAHRTAIAPGEGSQSLGLRLAQSGDPQSDNHAHRSWRLYR